MVRPISAGVTSSSESGLDPVVRARLQRLIAEAGPRPASGEALPAVPDLPRPVSAPSITPSRPPSRGAGSARVPRSLEGTSRREAAASSADESDDPPVDVPAMPSLQALVGSLRLAKRHAWVLALLVLIGVVASSGWSLRARAVEVAPPVVVSSHVVPPGGAGPSAATPSPSPASPSSPVSLVTVHVLGAVVRPGVVAVAAPVRVRDVIAAAGGLRPDADPGELNLAAVVADGSQVVIGTSAQPRGEVRGGSGPVPATGATAGALVVDLNTATADQLDQLPGVGPVTAAAILAWRARNGRFTSVAELQEVDGIGPKTFQELAPHVRV